MKIGIILGSVRTKRATEAVAQFVNEIAQSRTGDFRYELIDLAEFDLPLLTSPVHPMAAKKNHDNPQIQKWSDVIDTFDAYVFVTPEYNHGVPGAFKNAVDTLGGEWVGKPVAFIGHGSVGGVRSIEQWRQIVSNFSMPFARAEVNFLQFFDWKEGVFEPLERREAEVTAVLDQLETLITTIRG